MTEPLRVGMVGCGLVMELKHMRALQHTPAIQVVAACDPDSPRLKAMGEKFSIPRLYPNLDALLADSEIEAIGVCTEPSIHHEAVLAAIDAGKHVLVEKPLALDLDICDRMISRAQQSTVKVQVGFHMR